jgi:transglutaminase-like putative cysteine protease
VFAPAGLVWVQAPGFSVGMTPEGNRQLIGNPPSSRSVAYQAWALRPDYSPDDLRILSQTRIYPNPLISPKTTVECPPSVSALAREWAGMLADDRATLTRRLNELTASRLSPARSAYVGALMKEAGRLDRRIAQRIADRLKREYGYTLDLSEARRDRDAVEHFLFSMKAGHCEYFASSLTLMCRSLGVNARLATGFLTTEYDPSSATYIVRQRDAHAWTEVYAPQTGWAVVDATPGGPGPRDAGSLDGLSQWWAGVKFWWKERVIGYDRISQMNLVREIKQKLVELWAWIERTYAEVLAGLQELLLSGRITQAVQSFAVFIGICGVTILGVLLRRLHIERRREKHEIRQELGVSRRDLKFMVDLVVLLEKYKIHRRSHWTFMDLAQRAARQLSLDGKEVTALVDLYYRIRWGRSGVSREEVRQAEGLVARLEKRLSGRQAKQT